MLHIRTCDDQVPNAKRTWKDDPPDGIDKMQIIDNQESRHHAPVKQHRKCKYQHENIAGGQILPGKWVCRHQRHDYIHYGSNYSINNTVVKSSNYIF